jgi:hypothetical protein
VVVVVTWARDGLTSQAAEMTEETEGDARDAAEV